MRCLPSTRAKKMPPTVALPIIDTNPVLAAKTPPVSAPLNMEFHGSSLRRQRIKVHSIAEKRPPQTAKLPEIWGTRFFTVVRPPWRRRWNPDGAFRKPIALCSKRKMISSQLIYCMFHIIRTKHHWTKLNEQK